MNIFVFFKDGGCARLYTQGLFVRINSNGDLIVDYVSICFKKRMVDTFPKGEWLKYECSDPFCTLDNL